MEDNMLQPQPLTVIQEEMEAATAKAKEAEADLASVVVTPAWDAVRELLEAKSSDTAICSKLRPLITDASVSDAQLGALTRSSFMSATDLANTLELVLETVKAHEK